MKSIIFLGLICALTMQQTVLISSNAENTIITDPANAVTTLEAYYNLNYPNFIGYDAKWIYKNGTGKWPCGDYAVFYAQFYVDCTQDATLIITADDEFEATVNGGPVYTGCDQKKIYRFNLNCLKCGVNNLTIRVKNKEKNTPAALIFAVVQDQCNCYKCATPLSFYNRKTCKCECLDHCDCNGINKCFVFNDYPVCGCKCKKTETCPPLNYFNENTCKCECKHTVCPPGYEQSKETCKCVSTCPKKQCPSCQVWNQNQCKCVCPQVLICKAWEKWNADKCVCEKLIKKECRPHD